jgi:hypothetical protein
MARGRSHLPLTIKHLNHSMFWTIWSNQACTEIAGEPKNEPGVCKIQLGKKKCMCRYSVPETVARRIHTRLFSTAA